MWHHIEASNIGYSQSNESKNKYSVNSSISLGLNIIIHIHNNVICFMNAVCHMNRHWASNIEHRNHLKLLWQTTDQFHSNISFLTALYLCMPHNIQLRNVPQIEPFSSLRTWRFEDLTMNLSFEFIECLFRFAHQFDLIYIFNSPYSVQHTGSQFEKKTVSKCYHFLLHIIIIKTEVLSGFITRIINNWKASILFHFLILLLFVNLIGFSSFMNRKDFLTLSRN